MTIIPLQDRIIVRPLEQDAQTKNGLIMPSTVKEQYVEGEVISVGPGMHTINGALIDLQVKKGDRVLFLQGVGVEIKVDEEKLLMMREFDLIGILNK